MMRYYSLYLVAWIAISALLVIPGSCSTLYGYYYTNSTGASGLVTIDPQTGASSDVCDLSSLPELLGASGSSYTAANTLLFYTINSKGNISIVEVDPSTCKTTTTMVTGLNNGQNDVRDIKYDSVNNMVYMVFPNPFCLHGSLDKINLKTGAVMAHLANVADPVGLSQTASIDGKIGAYYFVTIPIGVDTIDYQLNKVDLTTGNSTTITLANNDLDIGDMWSSNYTLNTIDTSSGVVVFGAVSPSTATVKQCSPSGFYTIDSTTGNVTCTFGPIPYEVYPLAELDPSTLYYYQLFTDSTFTTFYLTTYDAQTQKVVSTTPCKMCSQISVLAAMP